MLPEGPLRRFRLPESFGDEAPTRREIRAIPLGAVAGWLSVCVCSLMFARGALDPIAMLERRWEVPTDESGAGRIAMAAAFGPVATAGSIPLTSGVTSAARPAAVTLTTAPPPPLQAGVGAPLPRVSFPDVGGHGGGFLAAPNGSPRESAETAPLDGETEAESDLRSGRQPSGVASVPSHASSRAAAHGAAAPFQSSLADAVRDLVAGSDSGLPRPGASDQGPDPFEADFGAGTLPSLSQGTAVGAPVKLSASRTSPIERRETPDTGVVPVSGERGTVTWNGGCQRAFDSSVQRVGDGPALADASGEDYSRALSRLDVTACRPAARTSIDVCVAVSNGRASGVTVHTKPSTPALGQCVARRVRGLSFPASGGTDLVRTQFRVD